MSPIVSLPCGESKHIIENNVKSPPRFLRHRRKISIFVLSK